MSMSQRTSSAAELRRIPPAPEGFADSKGTKWGTPVSMFEFAPAKAPTVGLVYLKPQSKTEHGTLAIFDGFYLDSRGGRPTIAVLVGKGLIKGTYPEEAHIPVEITKTGSEIYFLTRAMAEYCVKMIERDEVSYEIVDKVCRGMTFNNMLDRLEDGDQAGHFEDGMTLIVDAKDKDGSRPPVFIGLTEMLLNKKVHLVHVVGELDRLPETIIGGELRDRDQLKNPAYYMSETLARYAYRDRVAGRPLIASMTGRTYDGIQQHIVRAI